MDNQEAKFILSAYRPGGQDANDPGFFEAIEQAHRDPVLERWFQDSIAFDTAVSQQLCALSAPRDLQESILAGAKITRASHWTNRMRKWAIAAAVILGAILGGLIWHNTRPAHLTGWQNAALDVLSSLVRQESSFDAQSRDPGELLAWLRANHAPTAEKFPNTLGKLSSLGCKTFLWNDERVSVICFARPDGGLIHVVIAAGRYEPARAGKGRPEFIQQGNWATATWREAGKSYMLALEGSTDQLRAYLL
jgi:hypothetical protein